MSQSEKTEVTTTQSGREFIYARAKDRRANDAAVEGDPVSQVNQRMAKAMAAEAAGEEYDSVIGTEDIEAEERSLAERMEAEAAGEEIEDTDEESVQQLNKSEKPVSKDAGKVAVKVDGIEQQVPEWEVEAAGGVEAYQKRRAASKRLQEAAQIRLEAEQAAAALRNTPAKPAGATPPDGVSDQADLEANSLEAFEKLYEGDLESAKKAWLKFVRSSNRAVTSEEPAKPVEIEKSPELLDLERRLAEERKAQIAAANAVAEDEFGDYLEDSTLRELMYKRFDSLYKDPNNVGREMADLVRESGLWLRTQFNQSSSQNVQKIIETKTVKKRRLPSESTASGRHATAREAEPKPLKGSDVIARMKERYGQQR